MGTRATTAVLAAGTVLAVTGCGSTTAPELAVFDRPATVEDAVPDGISSPEKIGETRFIAEANGALVYAARGSDDFPWCVVVVAGSIEDGNWVVGSSCTDAATFEERGVWSTVSGAEVESGAAMLLPDDFDGDIQPGWEIAGPNLALPTE